MKKLVIMSVWILSCFTFKAADAQVTINLNIRSQPEWGPAGYDHAEYYYLPDIDVYYHVADRSFTYLSGGQWITERSLPARYRNYDLYKGYKVVMNESRPWARDKENKIRFAKYKGHTNQRVIRDSRTPGYASRTSGARMNPSYDNKPDNRSPNSRQNNNRQASSRMPGRS